MRIRFIRSFMHAAFLAAALTLPSGAANASLFSSGTTLWVATYNAPGNDVDYARAVAASPDGTKVFVTGRTFGGYGTFAGDYATVAYSAATGAQLWSALYNGTGDGDDEAASIAVSPDGSKVFVTGFSFGGPTSDFDYATVAYDASTGAQLWAARYDGPAHQEDDAFAIAAGSDGRKVFVTGKSVALAGGAVGVDYATVAYNASTGARLWTSRYAGLGGGAWNFARAIAVSPDATRVFVTGWSYGGSTPGMDYATVAYKAATGARLWVRRYNGSRNDDPQSIVVNGDGTTVFVTGYSGGAYATIAYSASTGATRWLRLLNGATFIHASIAVSGDGTKVFVAGSIAGTTSGSDYATVAYRGSSGARLWARRFAGAGDDWAYAVAVNANGTKVFVTGKSYAGTTTDYNGLTIAYAASTGGQLWLRRYDGLGHGFDAFYALAASGPRVFVTGQTYAGGTAGLDAVTVAYQG